MTEIIQDDRFEDLFEMLLEHGDIVFSNSWDTGNPGAGAGTSSIYKYRDKYWAVIDGEIADSFETFEDALDYGFLSFDSSTEEISCSHISTDELVKKLNVDDYGEESFILKINGIEYQASGTEGLKRV